MSASALSRALRDRAPERLRKAVGRYLPRGAHQDAQWVRVVMNGRISEAIASFGPEGCAAVEISGDLHRGRRWASYETLRFPEFDLSSAAPGRQYDVVVCEQVLEHVPDPWRAARTLGELCRPGGHVIVSTPFLIKIHREPGDYWRFTPDGLRILLEAADLEVVSVDSWGNRACVRGNFRHWIAHRPWHSLRHEPDFPVAVWAHARRRVDPSAEVATTGHVEGSPGGAPVEGPNAAVRPGGESTPET